MEPYERICTPKDGKALVWQRDYKEGEGGVKEKTSLLPFLSALGYGQTIKPSDGRHVVVGGRNVCAYVSVGTNRSRLLRSRGLKDRAGSCEPSKSPDI